MDSFLTCFNFLINAKVAYFACFGFTPHRETVLAESTGKGNDAAWERRCQLEERAFQEDVLLDSNSLFCPEGVAQ